jgi:hypothetical protein
MPRDVIIKYTNMLNDKNNTYRAVGMIFTALVVTQKIIPIINIVNSSNGEWSIANSWKETKFLSISTAIDKNKSGVKYELTS